MPPKTKITKQDIIDKAIDLIREGQSLTAATLSKALKCSTQPIFWSFNTMEDVKQEVFKQVHQEFSQFLRLPIEGVSPYKEIGMRYIQFAREERELFKLLFMSERCENENILLSDPNVPFLIDLVSKTKSVDKDKANEVYKIMWLFCHGIATMIAMKAIDMTDQEVAAMLDTVCSGIVGTKTNETSTSF